MLVQLKKNFAQRGARTHDPEIFFLYFKHLLTGKLYMNIYNMYKVGLLAEDQLDLHQLRPVS